MWLIFSIHRPYIIMYQDILIHVGNLDASEWYLSQNKCLAAQTCQFWWLDCLSNTHAKTAQIGITGTMLWWCPGCFPVTSSCPQQFQCSTKYPGSLKVNPHHRISPCISLYLPVSGCAPRSCEEGLRGACAACIYKSLGDPASSSALATLHQGPSSFPPLASNPSKK